MQMIEIGEVCEVYDGPHATPKKTSDGPIYLGIDAITDEGKINPMGYSYLSEDDFLIWTKRVTPKYGDLVFSYEATLGRYVLIPKGFHGCLGRRLAVVRPKDERINIKWLYYFFLSPAWKAFIDNNTVKGSTVNRISIEDFPKFKIPLIDRLEQDRIVDVLSVLDDKIDNNIAVNDNLSSMAYDTYMHTFYGKNSNGKLNDILVENDKSKVQVGEAKESDGDYPFFTSGEAILRWKEKFVDGRNCFLNTGGNADVKFYVGKAAYSTDTWCISANQELADYMYLLLLSIKPELDKKFFQGTGLKHLQKPLLKERPIYIPTEKEILVFNSQIQSWFDNIAENARENQYLIELRNWLLPMLMNGQATISD